MFVFIDLPYLRKTLERAISTYTVSDFVELSALASRLVARRCHSFRSQYGFQFLRKTTVAVARLHQVNIIDILSNFLGTLPDYQLPTKISLPTRDNFDYVLIRLQGLSKIFVRIVVCAKECSHAFLKYIHRNFFLETCVLYVGLLAQIWDLAKRLCESTVDLYAKLFPFRLHFKNNKKQWNNGHSVEFLPETLDTFIGVDFEEIMQHTTKMPPYLQPIHNVSNMLKINFQEFLDDEPMVIDDATPHNIAETTDRRLKNESIKIVKQEFRRIETTPMTTSETDIGLPINRATMTENLSLNTIGKVEDVQKFLRTEEQNRLIGTNKFSRQLSDTQWRDIRKQINQIIVTSHGRLAVKKFKKLWSNTTGTM